MSIQKKSLTSTLKTAKKANFAAKTEGEVKSEKQVSAVSVSSPRTLKSAARATFRTSARVL